MTEESEPGGDTATTTSSAWPTLLRKNKIAELNGVRTPPRQGGTEYYPWDEVYRLHHNGTIDPEIPAAVAMMTRPEGDVTLRRQPDVVDDEKNLMGDPGDLDDDTDSDASYVKGADDVAWDLESESGDDLEFDDDRDDILDDRVRQANIALRRLTLEALRIVKAKPSEVKIKRKSGNAKADGAKKRKHGKTSGRSRASAKSYGQLEMLEELIRNNDVVKIKNLKVMKDLDSLRQKAAKVDAKVVNHDPLEEMENRVHRAWGEFIRINPAATRSRAEVPDQGQGPQWLGELEKLEELIENKDDDGLRDLQAVRDLTALRNFIKNHSAVADKQPAEYGRAVEAMRLYGVAINAFNEEGEKKGVNKRTYWDDIALINGSDDAALKKIISGDIERLYMFVHRELQTEKTRLDDLGDAGAAFKRWRQHHPARCRVHPPQAKAP